MRTYLTRHAQVMVSACGQLAQTPLATAMTLGVIAITMALPAGLHVLLDNLERISSGWQASPRISLYLHREVDAAAAQAFASRVQAEAGVRRVELVSAAAGLEEFKRLSGFGAALDALEENPLPAVLVVHPVAGATDPAAMASLRERLAANAEVELAQLDMEWVRRLHALLELAGRAVAVLASLLGLAVLLIVSNTIRLAILNRREEIEVISLLGGTSAFVRRPFLYSGLIQGLAGGTLAWMLVAVAVALLRGPMQQLSSLYGGSMSLHGPGPETALVLAAGGAMLGWIASWVAVGRHLGAIQRSAGT